MSNYARDDRHSLGVQEIRHSCGGQSVILRERSCKTTRTYEVHQVLGWLLGIFSTGMAVLLIFCGQVIPGLISLALAVVVLPIFDIPVVVRTGVMVIAFLIL